MRIVASRLALWWAAPAALLSLFLPAPMGSWLAALSVLAAGLSLSLRGRWKLRSEAAAPERPVEADEACLFDVTARVVRCATHARDVSEALHGTARVLVHELGADGLLTGRLDPRGIAWPTTVRSAARPGMLSTVAAEAAASGQVTTGATRGYAVPVMCAGRCVAWLEFRTVELKVDAAALRRLLTVVQCELNAVAVRCPEFVAGAGAGAGAGAVAAASNGVPAHATIMLATAAPQPDDAADTGPGVPPGVPEPDDNGDRPGDEPLSHPLLTRYLQCCTFAAQPVNSTAAGRHGFDPAALERLRELDPQGLNRLHERVVRAFAASTARLLPQMTEAAHADDGPTVRQLANTLKSASESVGAVKLALQCAEIEVMTLAEHDEELRDCIAALSPEIEIVLSVLRGQQGSCP